MQINLHFVQKTPLFRVTNKVYFTFLSSHLESSCLCQHESELFSSSTVGLQLRQSYKLKMQASLLELFSVLNFISISYWIGVITWEYFVITVCPIHLRFLQWSCFHRNPCLKGRNKLEELFAVMRTEKCSMLYLVYLVFCTHIENN